MPGWKAGTLLLLEMSRITRGNLTRDQALSNITKLIIESIPIDAVAILIYEPNQKSAYVASSMARTQPLVSPDITLKVGPDSCLAESAFNPSTPLILEKGHFDPVLGKLEYPYVAVVPMSVGEAVTGFMILGDNGNGSLFTINPEFIMSVGSQAALIASKSALIENLKQSEERYHMFMENAGDLVFILDAGGRFLYVNARSLDVLGYEPHELCGKYFGEFVTPESWAKTVSAIKQASRSRDKYIKYSWIFRLKGGGLVNMDVRASLVYQGFELLVHQGIARDTSAVKRLQKEIEERNKALNLSRNKEETMREYLSVADLAQEEERARIARELHDGAIQYLVALRRRFDLLGRDMASSELSDNRRGLLEDIDLMLDRSISDLREFARNLRPPVLDDFGFIPACEWLCDQAEKEGFHVEFQASGNLRQLPREVEVSVFRIVQEGLSNAVKHSDAKTIRLFIEFHEDALDITIKDDGKGFEPPDAPGNLVRAGQMGLVGMFERAELLGAKVNLVSDLGVGTALGIKIPVKPQSA